MGTNFKNYVDKKINQLQTEIICSQTCPAIPGRNGSKGDKGDKGDIFDNLFGSAFIYSTEVQQFLTNEPTWQRITFNRINNSPGSGWTIDPTDNTRLISNTPGYYLVSYHATIGVNPINEEPENVGNYALFASLANNEIVGSSTGYQSLLNLVRTFEQREINDIVGSVGIASVASKTFYINYPVAGQPFSLLIARNVTAPGSVLLVGTNALTPQNLLPLPNFNGQQVTNSTVSVSFTRIR